MSKLNLNTRSLFLFSAVTIAWIVGGIELADTITNFSTQWFWLVLSILYVIVLNELFFHLIIGHLSFRIDPRRIGYKILVFLTTVNITFGNSKGMLLFHKTHHLYSDQDELDYLSFRKKFITSVMLSPLMYIYDHYDPVATIPDYKNYIEKEKKKYQYLLDDPWTQFCDNYQIVLTLAWWLVIFMIFPVVFFKILLMGRLIISIATTLNGIVGHSRFLFGYRNFDTNDHSYNNLIVHYLFLGFFSTILHNNHHGMNCHSGHKHKYYEIDTGYWFIKYILKPMLISKNSV